MTLRWTVSIAALAGVALASLLLASSGPKADEQAALRLAGAESEGAPAASKDESEDASPQGDTGAKPAEPPAGASAEQADPGNETAGAKEKPQDEKPDSSAEKDKTEGTSRGIRRESGVERRS